MAGCLNEVNIIGNLARDVEVRSMQNGKRVASMTVATSESWKGQDGERKERVEFHRVVIFAEGLVGVAEKYLRKGSKVLVRGQLQTRKWSDNEGIERYSTEVTVQGFDGKLLLLDSKGGDAGDTEGQRKTAEPASDPLGDDEIPF